MNKLSLLLLVLLVGCVDPKAEKTQSNLLYSDTKAQFIQEGQTYLDLNTTVTVLSVDNQKYLVVRCPHGTAITKHEQIQAEKQ